MKQLTVMVTGLLLLSGTAVLAQGEKTTTSVTPTALPGEEKLTARERAERDFLMPARRKQAAALKAAAQAEAAAQTPTDVSAYHAEIAEAKAPEAAPDVKAPAVTHRRTYHRRSSSTRRHTTSTKKKVVHKSASGTRKTTSKRSRSRR